MSLQCSDVCSIIFNRCYVFNVAKVTLRDKSDLCNDQIWYCLCGYNKTVPGLPHDETVAFKLTFVIVIIMIIILLSTFALTYIIIIIIVSVILTLALAIVIAG